MNELQIPIRITLKLLILFYFWKFEYDSTFIDLSAKCYIDKLKDS